MIIAIKDVADSQYLAGAEVGRKLLGALITQVGSSVEPEPIFLDFDQVAVATSSFIREAVLGFRDYSRSTKPNLYPVVANANPGIVEELEFYLEAQRDAIWICELDANGQWENSRLLGVLDPVARRTFEAVTELGSATVAQVASRYPDPAIKKAGTAWNNRLAALVRQGVLMESRSGVAKIFTPVLGGS